VYQIPVYHKKTDDHNKKKRPKNKADRTFAGFPLGFLSHRHNFMICGLTQAVNRRDGFPRREILTSGKGGDEGLK
jgi:hypothetical protein